MEVRNMNKKMGIILSVVFGALLVIGCKPDYPNCKTDEHCHEGEFCVNNLCQQCRGDQDCPQGQECAGGGCRDIPNYCATSADCAAGQVCRDNTCGPCTQNEECGDGQVCADGACIDAECQSDDQCPAGLSCVNYKCVNTQPTTAVPEGQCSLESVYFEFDSSEVDSAGRSVLDQNFACMQENDPGQITLEGHCDAAGTTEYNMALGERRARMVQKLMKAMGVDGARMRVVSKGEEESTAGNVAKDRRVDFK
jgi:peptidoglycan-associated lipoprotein